MHKFGFMTVGVVSSISTLNASATEIQKPNVIMVFVDDMGYGDLGCYGNPNNKTPILDMMAENGAKFTHFYVGGPMCTPAPRKSFNGLISKT